MPEGPTIILLKEEVQAFKGKKVLHASGITKTIDPEILTGKKITDFKSFGKEFLVCFGKNLTLRIHFGMFGSYRINERKETNPRLHLEFAGGEELNFYTCSLRFIEKPLDELYDWSADVMNDAWDGKAAIKKLKAQEDELVCDVLLDQDIFAGVGNIIKNEVLYRIRVNPDSRVGALPAKQLKEMVKEASGYSFDFLNWKREFTLKKHWLAHKQKVCKQCGGPIRKEYYGKRERRSFFCEHCQELYK